jgi:hypothetical protein
MCIRSPLRWPAQRLPSQGRMTDAYQFSGTWRLAAPARIAQMSADFVSQLIALAIVLYHRTFDKWAS